MKKFAALETLNNDYILSPTYDVIDTRIHVDDTNFALNGGLIKEELRSVGYRKTGNPEHADFIAFGAAIGVSEKRIDKLLAPFCERQEMVEELVSHSCR